jgi:hypothetical protein
MVRSASNRRRFRPQLEGLEDRCVPSVFPATNEIQVSQSNVGSPQSPAVAAAPDGRSVVAYTTGTAIYVRLYNADGTPTGGPFAVTGPSATAQSSPSVAMDPAGDFVVTWAGLNQGIVARRYDAAGQARGNEFVVSSNVASDYPHVAMDASGDYVIAWQSGGAAYSARIYNAAGQPTGNQFDVAGNAVAMDSAGDFVVAGAPGTSSVTAQRYNLAGVAQGGPIAVSQSSNGTALPAVAMDPAGDFVVAWESDAPDGSTADIHARRFNSAGVALSNEFTVNLETLGYHAFADVSMDATGGFVISWEDMPVNGVSLQGANIGVYARRFDAAGNDIAGEMEINPGATDDNPALSNQDFPAVAMDAAGDFVVAWQDAGSATAAPSVGARLYLNATAGYSYNAVTKELTVTAEHGGNYFRFDDFHLYADLATNDLFTINDVQQTYPDSTIAHVTVNYQGPGNDTDLYTDSIYAGTDGQDHETVESVSVGQGGGTIYRIDAQNQATRFLDATGFKMACVYLGIADTGQVLGTAGVQNNAVISPTYTAMYSGDSLYEIFGEKVHAYAANAGDTATLNGGTGATWFGASGSAYSYMTGMTTNSTGTYSYFNEAVGFRFTDGVAQNTAQATAYLYDTPGNDVFSGSTSSSYIYADNPDGTIAYYNEVQSFGQVFANSSSGGVDYAYVYDAGVNHLSGNWQRLV